MQSRSGLSRSVGAPTERRFQTSLLIGFSAVARTHEIGVRMAVGAQPGEIFRMIICEGLKLSLTRLVLGLVGALWLGRAGSSLLFGVTATDPLTFITVAERGFHRSLLFPSTTRNECRAHSRTAARMT